MIARPLDPTHSGRRTTLAWTFLALVILAQWGLFSTFIRREIAGFPPAYADQTGFLTQTYHVHEILLAKGFLGGAGDALTLPRATGVLLPLQAALLFLFCGASRLVALNLNFFYFGLFQGVLCATVRWRGRRWDVAFFALGLLLTAQAPLQLCGGLTDFRLDSIAFSLFGIFLCVVVRGRFFASRRWSLAAGGVAATLVLFRFLSAVYLAGILGLCLVAFGVRWCAGRRDPAARRAARRRLAGLCLGGLVTAAATVPFLALNARSIWNYYAVGHLTGAEKEVRAEEFGITTPAQFYLYYARSLYAQHTGPLFFTLAGAAATIALLLRLVPRPVPPGSPGSRSARPDRWPAWVFLGACLVVPFAVLTANVSKSPVVGSILVPPLLWLALLPLIEASRAGGRGARGAVSALAVLALVAGAGAQLGAAARRCTWSQHKKDAAEVAALCEEIARGSLEGGPRPTVVSVNCLSHVTLPTLFVYGSEKHGALLNLTGTLGNSGIMDVDESAALAELAKSDFVLLCEDMSLPTPCYPFHRRMRALLPQMREFCEREMLPVKRTHILDWPFTLYERPHLRVEGDSEGWVTDRGMTLTGSAAALRMKPTVRLRGVIPVTLLGGVPRVFVSLRRPRGAIPVPSTLTIAGHEYCIDFRLEPSALGDEGPVAIDVRFDRYFVPRDVGLNPDPRKLVLFAPSTVDLAR